mgnify:CR=1 FL=1
MELRIAVNQLLQSLVTGLPRTACYGQSGSLYRRHKNQTPTHRATVTAMSVGRSVLLVDCDLRKPKVHWTLGLQPQVGLAEVLLNQATVDEAITKLAGVNLDVLPVRMIPSNPSELLASPEMLPKISQGVTTVVTGNCGISLAPLVHANVPPPLNLLGGPDKYIYPTTAAYAAAVDAARPAVNVAALVGHSTLRVAAMGDPYRAATAAEQARMGELLREGMAAGATGLSSGVFYPPGAAADIDELALLAGIAGEMGGVYTTHIRQEADQVLDSLDEAFITARRGRVPLVSRRKFSTLVSCKNSCAPGLVFKMASLKPWRLGKAKILCCTGRRRAGRRSGKTTTGAACRWWSRRWGRGACVCSCREPQATSTR